MCAEPQSAPGERYSLPLKSQNIQNITLPPLGAFHVISGSFASAFLAFG